MRHGNKINHLGRKKAHRDALLKNLSNALITHKRITTTLAKAKELRRHIEPIITKCKVDSTHNRRMIFSYLQDKESVKELFGTISDKVASRPGGYTRIIKLGFRYSDAAEMAMIELVDFNEIYKTDVKQSGSKTRRRRKKSSSSNTAAVDSQDNNSNVSVDSAPDQEVKDDENNVVETPETITEVSAEETTNQSTQSDNTSSESKETSEVEDTKE